MSKDRLCPFDASVSDRERSDRHDRASWIIVCLFTHKVSATEPARQPRLWALIHSPALQSAPFWYVDCMCPTMDGRRMMA